MRISDWSSDVCSSDLNDHHGKAHHDRLVYACANGWGGQWQFSLEQRLQWRGAMRIHGLFDNQGNLVQTQACQPNQRWNSENYGCNQGWRFANGKKGHRG